MAFRPMWKSVVRVATLVVAIHAVACGPSPAPEFAKQREDEVAETVELRPPDAHVGARECLGCHPDVAATYPETGMGRAFYPLTSDVAVEDFSDDNEFVVPGSGLRYRMVVRDGRYYQRQFVQDLAGDEWVVDEREMQWVIGSGNHARSYITAVGDELFQMPICWYPEASLWDLCPGYEHKNDHFSREITLSCVFCHNGRMVPEDGATNVFEEPVPHGIGCERCHGPGRAHVEYWRNTESVEMPGLDTIVNPRNLPSEERIHVCIQCHFGDSKAAERVTRRDRSLLDYRPGMPITDVFVPFWMKEVSTLEFGLSAQADRLLRSRCYRESEGRLECLTCHDPHVSVYSEHLPADRFNKECLGCHDADACAAPPERREATDPADDCIVCHMRKAEADDQRFAVFTDHWIRARTDEPGKASFVPETVPVFPEAFGELTPGEQAFYRGRAHMLSAMDLSDPARREMFTVAEESFRTAIREGLGAAETWVFLGMVLDFLRRLPDAEEAFARAWAEDPGYREAAFNLGTTRLRLGKVAEAEVVLRALLGTTPDDVGALAELGRCALMTGRFEEAVGIYDRAIELAPTLASLRSNRGAALAKLGRFEGASRDVEKATSLNPDDPDLWGFWAELLKRTDHPVEAERARGVAARLE
jgi:predicted CXXCH cytochrome family protein